MSLQKNPFSEKIHSKFKISLQRQNKMLTIVMKSDTDFNFLHVFIEGIIYITSHF